MSCYICGMRMDTINLDRDFRPRPCSHCEAAIQECVDGYPGSNADDPDNVFTYIDTSINEFAEELTLGHKLREYE